MKLQPKFLALLRKKNLENMSSDSNPPKLTTQASTSSLASWAAVADSQEALPT